MSFIQARRSFVGYCPSLILEPGKKYPELTDLNFHFENSQTGLVLTDLLGNNMQLESIAISGHLLTPHQFELISQCKHLTQVRLKPIYFSIDEVPLNNLDFPSVTQLTIKISKYQPPTIINYLLSPFHKSVTNLTLGYSKELQEFYNSIISNFTKVTQLKLIILGKFDTLNNLTIPKSVNFLDISNYSKINDSVNNNEAIIRKLEDYHNLKRVGITYKSRCNSLLNTDCNTDYSLVDYNGCSWKVINYPLSNQFHRFL
ncbi:hypothetical protein CONCODRAFT_73580 [Conidiobolus coronatus NRRL 28638]|uniref:F-box domain-containing protein n=1 Tax=Conidiobolus coronatus (strain ATCC 28846 / CBS 209.66 / NRRL 28638) TaxID=796925 RepID=A0A137NVA0_CONC2|nr:hypothetical protein CONCODRAFT_73580 [Conidiobolus coronatus NRRL 28638]|eukprot:KXN66618.1 hypothetical protein CONCODRAFT_73580 [Conidiobolus coronatus NRRL 28638]